jgi:hypothetical protein
VIQSNAEGAHIVNAYALKIVAQHRFNGMFPSGHHRQSFTQTLGRAEASGVDPILRRTLVTAQGGTLNGLQAGEIVSERLQLTTGLLDHALPNQQIFPDGAKGLDGAIGVGLQAAPPRFDPGYLFGQGRHVVAGKNGHLLGIVKQLVVAASKTLKELIEVLHAGGLNLCVPFVLRRSIPELVPFSLPRPVLLLELGQAGGGQAIPALGLLPARLQLGELLTQLANLRLVHGQLTARFLRAPGNRLQVELELLDPLLVELNGLLDARDVRTELVKGPLNLVDGGAGIGVSLATLLDLRVDGLLLRLPAAQLDLELLDPLPMGVEHGFERHQTDGVQLGSQLALFLFELSISLRRAGLTLEMLKLPVEFLTDVVEPVQVFPGMANPVLGLPATLLVLRDPGCFLKVDPQVFGFRLDELADHPLLDDGVAARTESRAEEDVHDVPAPAFVAVEEVGGLGFPGDLAPNRDLGVCRVLAADPPVLVAEDQLDAGDRRGLARIGTVEDDVGEVFTAQLLRRTFTHDPSNRVDDVGLAATVRANDGAPIAGEDDGCRVDERLEASELDLL